MEWYHALPESSNWSKRGQYPISSTWNDITHELRIQIGRSEVSIKSTADEMTLRTGWEFKRTSWEFELVKARSVSNRQHMEWHYARTENSNWSNRGQYQINSRWNGITHFLRVRMGRREVSLKLAAHGMTLRTNWEFKFVEARSVSN